MMRNEINFLPRVVTVLIAASSLIIGTLGQAQQFDKPTLSTSTEGKPLDANFTTKQLQLAMSEQIVAFEKKHEVRFKADRDSWKLLTNLVASTVAPPERIEAAAFLDDGFKSFLKDYATFWLKRHPGMNDDITFDAKTIEAYYRDRRDSCGENPCPAPPCCRTGMRCGVCQKKFEFPTENRFPRDRFNH